MNNKYTFIGINTEEEINIYDKNDKLYFTCTDSYDGATIELTKDKAIELANKILEMCKVKINITGIGVNPSPTSKETDIPFEGYRSYRYFKLDNKACENCGCNPKNGGSGNCNCTLASPTIY